MARRLRERGQHIVGLVPADPGLEVRRVTCALALALARLSGGAIACVDAASRWPLPPGREGRAMYWLSDAVAVLEPMPAARPGDGPQRLADLIARAATRFDYVLIDLSELSAPERVAAVDIVDGVVGLARSSHTSTRSLERLRRRVARSTPFGVVLVGS